VNEIIIADLDGTIALDHGRAKTYLHSGERDWDAYFDHCHEDLPNSKIIDLLCEFSEICHIWIFSGRVQRTREVTGKWLEHHGVPYNNLLMRADGDRTQDFELKIRWAIEFGMTPEAVWFILEDRKRVVEAWRAAGYTCLQVAAGEF